jgi:Ni,Fe-hydrogenase III large subunit/Ni,Fe-hydrogenase III component G
MDPTLRLDLISDAFPIVRRQVTPVQWIERARSLQEGGGILLALWGNDDRDRNGPFVVRAAIYGHGALTVLELAVKTDPPEFLTLSSVFPSAERMERAVRDLLGICAVGSDGRPWLRHAAWRAGQFPLRHDFSADAATEAGDESYPFVSVDGDGVHEIAVGPVHAGTIEPGHFRFSVIGEKVLRLEERLGYVHKGIEKRFEGLSILDGHRLAARVSGDSAVAFSWAYCMALEGICHADVPARALQLRALALELERIANHLGDLGALGNDAGLAFGLAQFSRLKEELLRAKSSAFGSRYLLDYVVPGGVASDIHFIRRKALLEQLASLDAEVRKLREIYDDHSGLQDRFAACGWLAPGVAQRLGVVGLAGRASAQPLDIRCDLALAPYDRLEVHRASHTGGDVEARVWVRFEETFESIRLCRTILDGLPEGNIVGRVPPIKQSALRLGIAEGWRGPVLVALEADSDGLIRRCHPHDPSWQNWPALEHAIIGNIVPDFPLINKSFNLSYSGHDL